MKVRTIVLCLAVLFTTSESSAQDTSLRLVSEAKTYLRFAEGQRIKVEIDGKEIKRGELKILNDSTLSIGDDTVGLSQITAIRQTNTAGIFIGTMGVAGGLYLTSSGFLMYYVFDESSLLGSVFRPIGRMMMIMGTGLTVTSAFAFKPIREIQEDEQLVIRVL